MDNPDSETSETNTAGTGEQSSNLAITIVIVVGILLAAILLFRAPQEDKASPTPGPGTPAAVQPMATPPTAVQPTAVPPTAVQATAVQPTIPPMEPSPIQGINWQWTNVTDSSNGQVTTVPTPASRIFCEFWQRRNLPALRSITSRCRKAKPGPMMRQPGESSSRLAITARGDT